MGTPLQWFSFAIPFRLYDPYFPFPFRWVSKEKKLVARRSNKFKKWEWLGPYMLIVTCCLYAFQILKLVQLDKKERQGLEFYIKLLGAVVQFFISGIVSQYAMYYTKNSKEMGVLFTDSHKAMAEAITRFNAWNLFPHLPFYKDFLGLAFCADSKILLGRTACLHSNGILYDRVHGYGEVGLLCVYSPGDGSFYWEYGTSAYAQSNL
ncbi:unnamed protein product [Orchesella dallaii]|uniref:Uncharacterized protein n=1 Tax=Orchesella dallaii TaxID=48710 RepID=A0ABP1S114_9HEXA